MKKLLKLSAVIVFFYILEACGDLLPGNEEGGGEPPEGALLDSSEYEVIVDEEALASRMELLNTPVEFDTTNWGVGAESIAAKARSASSLLKPRVSSVNGISLTLNAEVRSTTGDGGILQATDVLLKGNTAFVTYAMVGDVFSGALQIINVTNRRNPALNSEVLFRNLDIYAVANSQNELVLAGAANPDILGVTTPAVVVLAKLQGNIPQEPFTIVDLPSFAATDVVIIDDYLFVSVGAEEGGLVRINLEEPELFSENEDVIYFDDARSVDEAEGWLAVLKGTPGEVMVLASENLTDPSITMSDLVPERHLVFDETATIPFSKSTIELMGDVSLLAVGDGGTIAIFTESGTPEETLFQLPPVTDFPGLGEDLTVTNAASAEGALLFRANGEAGVDLFGLDADIDTVRQGESLQPERLGSLVFGEQESANSVYYRRGYLFIAGGLGGMKIVSLD